MSASVDQGPMGGGLEWTIERGGGILLQTNMVSDVC